MTRFLGAAWFVLVVVVVAHGQPVERKEPPVERLSYDELKSLKGWWELKVDDAKTGWKGTIYMEIRVFDPDQRREYNGYVLLSYDVHLAGKETTISFANATGYELYYAGVKQG